MSILKKTCLCLALVLALCLPVTAAEVAGTEPAAAIRYMDTLPGNWSPESEQTTEKEFLRALTTTAFYGLEDGAFTEGLALQPEDVTGEYAGDSRYGIPAGADRGYAFRITLREDVFWQDGAAVTADDVIFALEKDLEDYRWLANAEAYLAGSEQLAEEVVSLQEAGFESVSDAQAAGYTKFYVNLDGFWGLEAGWEPITAQNRIRDWAMPAGLDELYVTPAYLYRTYLAEGASLSWFQSRYVGVGASWAPLTAEDVGILRTGDHEIVLITGEPAAALTLAARLAGLCLVKQELSGSAYGTSPETYCSYGPYQIVSAGADEILLERNPHWQGEEFAADQIRCLPR